MCGLSKETHVTDTTTQPVPPAAEQPETAQQSKPRRSGGGLGGKVLAELQEIAGGLNISGASKMRKGELIDAIKAAQGGADKTAQAETDKPVQGGAGKAREPRGGAKSQSGDEAPQGDTDQEFNAPDTDEKPDDQKPKSGDGQKNDQRNDSGNRNQGGGNRSQRGDNRNQGDNRNKGGDNRNQGGGGQDGGNRNDDDFGAGGGRRRNRRGRNRGNRGPEGEPTYTDDDVLVPAAGILDILENYAFVRTTGYLPSENDVYLSLSMVRKWGLRKGDAVVGQVRQPREGERKEKFNPMVRVDSVNGMTIDEAQKRVDFSKLTPLFPTERLRLETEPHIMTTRIMDIMSPIGKGQRGLIVSPPKAGKTMIMQAIANAIAENNPECHLMVVLVDERPEEVTDMQRTVKGEVIASTFDRPASDHTTIAELSIERAKRLVELGHDVVVLLDSITRLGRAYNLAAPASGRIMSGGVDSSALYPPKKFFGAARNIEDGGSLTIIATALVETGSRMDEVIFEEFKGTGNMELRLRRDFADKRIFPAIDVDASSTRREELLMAKDELAVVWKLRRVLSGLEGQQGLELMLDRLKKASSNVEFLMSINKTMPQGTSNGED
ncbi:transcription termination factor Rho [Aeromicrobium sp.]|uniref:transcription termination factor Rho n=1 Tax=Aeromicrobium sp. TaxID=1871063 RepID=UPI003D6A8DF4